MDKDLQLLKDDSHYYGKFGKQFLSNSDIITLLNDPKNFRKEKLMTKAMLVGRYFHTAMLEPEKIDSVEFWVIDASSKYNYDSQAYLYQQFFNKPLIFFVVDKLTYELGVYYPSETFLSYGKDKVERAIEVYNKFFTNESTEDIETYVIKETL